MTLSLTELLAQSEALDRQIRQLRATKKAEAIEDVRRLMAEHGLTVADLVEATKKQGVRAGTKVAPKYRDPASGVTWTGRGLKPKWLSAALADGKALSDFAV